MEASPSSPCPTTPSLIVSLTLCTDQLAGWAKVAFPASPNDTCWSLCPEVSSSYPFLGLTLGVTFSGTSLLMPHPMSLLIAGHIPSQTVGSLRSTLSGGPEWGLRGLAE